MTSRPCQLFASAALATFLATIPSFAVDSLPPVVPGFDRLVAAGHKDAPAGALLLGELNCVSCHQTTAITRKEAPILDDVASRVRIGHLRKFLAQPQAVKPGTTMPAVFQADPDRDAKVEALVQFLATTGSLVRERADNRVVAQGRQIYAEVGCVACHGPRDAQGEPDKPLPTAVPLGDLKTKYSLASLTAFLDQPLHARPSGRMPKVVADGNDARAVASYLMQGAKGAPGAAGVAKYSYYEGAWTKLPDFDKLTPVATGTGAAFDLSVARRGDDYALRFESYFAVPRDLTFTFTLSSDDGSRVRVDDKEVVVVEGVHPVITHEGKVKLSKGVHKVVVEFFQAQGGAELAVRVKAAGFGDFNLADLVSDSAEALNKKPAVAKDDEDYLEAKPELADRGKALFASAGCVACHQLKAVTAAAPPAPALAALKATGGCLTPTPAKGLPYYSLSDDQRAALAAAVQALPAPPKEPAAAIALTMNKLNCYACHVRGDVGGAGPILDKSFVTTQPEMGDEGRVPPNLDGVGAKLNPDYLKNLLAAGAKDRPYMHTRMPGFGEANTAILAQSFPAVDKLPAVEAVKFTEPITRVKASARHLVGATALGCIKCHTFNGNRAEGVQGIDMTLMPRRLRHDWFHAYVANPPALRPGTRMPAAFLEGKSVLPDILGGTALNQLEAIWVYLSDGPKAQTPAGLGPRSILLIPDKTAVLYRNFIEGAGPRAIAVGYPERAHLAFDANGLRLALLWQGDFMDAGRHWTERGEGYQPPLGDNILHLPEGVSFARLASLDTPWPTTPAREQGYRFKGYRLAADERPTFLYQTGDVAVEDFPTPVVVDKDTVMKRTLTLASEKPPTDLYFRAAVGNQIVKDAFGWYKIDDGLKVKIEGGGEPTVRTLGGKKELLVPVTFAEGKARLVQQFNW
jgi:mono/diheme cytochrome c family protein